MRDPSLPDTDEPTRTRSLAADLCGRGGAEDLHHGKILIDAISDDKYSQLPPSAIREWGGVEHGGRLSTCVRASLLEQLKELE
ncbi:hypothetical protein Y032_0076g991 [Ancylostoma ceylanicum]|uniref:Uncharacterized protein n=1 Tax=Ancylostoma ceylanicum TaxID=53326 RepID=A0A016TVQ6_9BILA|nr:hypothetical protein Y032_0076g991 [Ancylostoma ceylanicum]